MFEIDSMLIMSWKAIFVYYIIIIVTIIIIINAGSRRK